MKREDFVKVAEETLDSLPEEFRSRIQNAAILVEDFPPNQSSTRPGQQRRLLLGIFHGVPATKKSVFDFCRSTGDSVRQQTPYRCQIRNRGLCASISSCLRLAAEMSLALSGRISGVSNISCICSISSMRRSTSFHSTSNNERGNRQPAVTCCQNHQRLR
jgi:predicted Zn-dependent protease with MMP-like domain